MQAHESLKHFFISLRNVPCEDLCACAQIVICRVQVSWDLQPFAGAHLPRGMNMIDLHAHVDSGLVGYRVDYPAENVDYVLNENST